MRNKSIKLSKKLAAVILCAAMTCGLLAGCGTDSSTSSTDSDNTPVITETTDAPGSSSGSGTAQKTETVYVTADPNGNVQEITVSDWLKNPDNYTIINDTTTLQNVIAVKGSDQFSQNGSDLVFTANGNDVYYRGSVPADTTLPVSVNITYTLDGKEISADELEGATGHLGIHVQYKNNTTYTATIDGKDKDIHVPFLAATMMLLSSDKARNLEIDNGKILENGDSDILIGYGFPGLNDSFGLDEDGAFTDAVNIEADVTDYSADMMMTFVTSEVFATSDLNEAVDFDSVSESLQEITDISIKDINDVHSIEDLEDVVEDLKDSCNELNDGANKIKDGAGDLKDGADKLKDGSAELQKGSADLKNGAETLKTNYSTFDSKLSLLNDKMTSASDGGAALAANMEKAAKESTTLAGGAAQVSGGVSALNTSLTGMYQAIASTIADNEKSMAQLKQAMAATTPGSEAYMNYYAQLNQLGGANAALIQIKNQMDEAKLSENLAALSSGAKQVSDGCTALNKGLQQLSSGASTLNNGLGQLSSGVSQLSAASGQIARGTGDLYEGTVKLNDGTKALYNGSAELYEGTVKLYDGAGELADGTAQLTEAFDGNITPLIDTVKALKDAAVDYTTFTSLSEGSNGTVSFVIKTE